MSAAYFSAAVAGFCLNIIRVRIMTRMIPMTPNGYATAYPIPVRDVSTPAAAKAELAAPREGVFVTAPQSIPMSTGTLLCISVKKYRQSVTTTPSSTIPVERMLRTSPWRRMESMKPGPTCMPMVYTKRIRPNSWMKWRTLPSTRRPRCPSRMPTKRAPAPPRLIPLTLILPTMRPMAAVSAIATTCCPTEGFVNKSINQFIVILRFRLRRFGLVV